MTRSGNRQLNAALHRIAVTQIRLDGLGQAYYRKRVDGRRLQHRSAALPQTPPGPYRSSTTSTPTNNNRNQPCQPAAA